MTKRYFDDLSTGETYEFGPRSVSEAAIVEFAERYDPQAIHLDESAAANSIFGELIASGWHTASVCMRLLVDGLLSDIAVVGAVGVDDLRWRAPVRAGDELRIDVTISNKEPWDDEKGLVELPVEAHNQNGELVMSRTDRVLIEQRE